ncbi:MAG: hotdog domain-containing protein [Methylococcales bacterium]|jgi:acyl-CoA hydrolase|nr:hotdog domain-containing protein [Methylococcales bacterium]
MRFLTRRLVMPGHLNSADRLFGGTLLRWVDEEAFIFAKCQLKIPHLVTRYISEINFVSPAMQDDIVEFGLKVTKIGNTSITLTCLVRNKETAKTIINIDKIVFVSVDRLGNPINHNLSKSLPVEIL